MSEWQGIESAPKDGVEILACDAAGITFVTSWRTDVYGGPGWFSDNYADRWGDQPEFDSFIHWQPLPDPPDAQGIAKAGEMGD